MSENTATDHGLVSQLHEIEAQPLADRAAAYAGLHEELSRRLESDPSRVASESQA